MKLVPGALYFIGEEDVFTGEVSPFYKIGLVRDERDLEKRLLEHSTGNPRRLFIHESLKSAAIDDLETSMHHRMARLVASGEWFKFDSSGLADAVDLANDLSSQVAVRVGKIKQSHEFAKILPEIDSLEPTSDVSELHKY
jgi:hypothetical protein